MGQYHLFYIYKMSYKDKSKILKSYSKVNE